MFAYSSLGRPALAYYPSIWESEHAAQIREAVLPHLHQGRPVLVVWSFKTFKNLSANMGEHLICNIPMEWGLTHKHMSTRWGCNRPESRPRAASVSLRQMVSPECVQSVGCMRWGVTAPLILQMQTDVWEGVSMNFKWFPGLNPV